MRAGRLLAIALGAGLSLALGAAPARADADSVLVRVGGDLAARAGQYLDVPITVDLSGAPGRSLGSYTATLTFDTTVFYFEGITNGNFAPPQVNPARAADSGKVYVTAVQPPGATGVIQIFIARFYVRTDTAASPISISFSEMSATATSVTPFESLLSLVRIVNGTFCRSLGLWGDVDGDGKSNSRDALVALSYVVGDTIPVNVKASLADVDGDGRVTSRDALIILSYAVGLPVPGTRILLVAAGACGTGVATVLTITPDSLELQAGQEVPVAVAALDSTGRGVPVDSVTWTSSDPSVAAFDANNGAVQARSAGVATLTVQLGPSVVGTLKVSVLARRTTWYVDVERARFAPTQTGSQALPMEFIGDALAVAHNGDTVRVASGTYEELVSADVAVVLLGDPANWPVLDPRGDPSWYQYDDALDLEPHAGLIQLENFDIRAGVTYLRAHDFLIRNVRIEGLNTQGVGLDLYSENYTPAPAPRPGGPMRSSVPVALGNVLVDGVVVSGDSLTSGIEVEQADSVVIRNSRVTRAQSGPYTGCGMGPYSSSGIVVRQASVSLAQSDTVVNPYCQGVGLFDSPSQTLVSDVSRVTASHNQVTGAPGTGIGAGARLVSFDHNVVRGTALVPGQRTYGYSAAMHVTSSYNCECNVGPVADSVVSLGDSVVNSGGRGFAVDSALSARIDSLVVSGSGLDSSGTASGVNLSGGGSFWLSYSHISNTVFSAGVLYTGENTNMHSHGNRIADAGENGLANYQGCDCAPPARPGPGLAGPSGPQRLGPYTGGPDTLTSVADTVLNAGSSGIYQTYGAYTLVDSAVVDAAGSDGIYIQAVSRSTISHSMVSGAYYGIYADEVDTLAVVRDTVQANYTGLYVYGYNTPDSATVFGSTFLGNSGIGMDLEYAFTRVDSSIVMNNGTGIYVGSSPGGARVRWTRFQANNIGMVLGTGASSSSVVNSNFLSDTLAGAVNNAGGPILVADTNYWGDPSGPACAVSLEQCVVSVGDSISAGVTFADWLSGPALTLAPPTRLAGVAARPARGPQAPRASITLPPRPPMPKAAANAVAPDAHQRQPAAWHAPSRAKTHAVQVLVKKRT